MGDQVWYYTMNGERQGPVALGVLQTLVSKGRLSESDMAWKNGMGDWVAVTSIKGISAKPKSDPISPPPLPVGGKPSGSMSTISDASIYEGPTTIAEVQSEREPEYTGIGRLAYFFMPMIILAAWFGIFYLFEEKINDLVETKSIFAGFAILGILVLSLTLPIFSRLKNLGMSGWNILWLLVPIMSWWIGYRLSACPPGYHHHKRLDLAAKIILGFYIASMVLAIGMFFLSALFVGAKAYKEGADEAKQRIEEQQRERGASE